MRPAQLLAAVVAMSSVTSALSGALDSVHGLADVKHMLMGRQDNKQDASSQAPQSSAAQTTDKPSDKPSATQSGDKNDNDSSTASGKASGSAKASGSQGTKVTTGKPSATSFDPRLPAGGVSMITPNALAGQPFYKVGNGNYVTFAWNYTSLSVTPSAIDVMASCSANQATYTIALNISAEQTKVIWDTNTTPPGQSPFLTEKYTLLIMDSNADITAAPRPGYLGVFNSFTFGMYQPQPYQNWTQFECPNCIKSGALSHSEKATLRVLLITSGTTVASLLYFAHNFGLW